ncbi:MAG: hypothetical protein HQL76_12265 [Magnetococcales bacterium]|nr:hypothetical protein [Magnetococcales bacterium]
MVQGDFLPRRAGSIRVACASDGDGMLDGHFGSCQRFMIHDVSVARIVTLEGRSCEGLGTEGRTTLIRDCQVVCMQAIGGPAAGRVSQAGVMPLKVSRVVPILEILERIQGRLADGPPPWMAKAMAGSDRLFNPGGGIMA